MKCKKNGCNRDVGYNPKTGKPNKYCGRCYASMKHSKGYIRTTQKPRRVHLNGTLLTANLDASTLKVRVSKYTRAVIHNGGFHGNDGNFYKYVIDLKEGRETIASIASDNKNERNDIFREIQALLENVY
jgi:hypothetical protein